MVRRAGVGRAERQRHPRLRAAAARGVSERRARPARLVRQGVRRRAAGAAARPLVRAGRRRADARRHRDRPRAPRRVRPRVRLPPRPTTLPPTYLHVARVPARAVAHDRAVVPVRRDRPRAHREPDRAAPAGRASTETPVAARARREPARPRQGQRRRPRRRGDDRRRGRLARRVDVPAPRGRRRRRLGGSSKKKAKRDAPPRATAQWKVPGDIGRRYADVSGDRNPIHLHPRQRQALRHARRDRPRDVGQGPLPGGARGPAARHATRPR